MKSLLYDHYYNDLQSVSEYSYDIDLEIDFQNKMGYCYRYHKNEEFSSKVNFQLLGESMRSQCLTYELYKISINEPSNLMLNLCMICFDSIIENAYNTIYKVKTSSECGNLTNHRILFQHWYLWDGEDSTLYVTDATLSLKPITYFVLY